MNTHSPINYEDPLSRLYAHFIFDILVEVLDIPEEKRAKFVQAQTSKFIIEMPFSGNTVLGIGMKLHRNHHEGVFVSYYDHPKEEGTATRDYLKETANEQLNHIWEWLVSASQEDCDIEVRHITNRVGWF